MEDNILQAKKEMKRIAKIKSLTRMERKKLIKEKGELLSEEERAILIEEFQRDYESYDRVKDVVEIISIFLTTLGLLIAVGNNLREVTVLVQMLYLISFYCMAAIISVSTLQSYRSANMNRTKYLLDMLSEKNEKKERASNDLRKRRNNRMKREGAN